ncbi:MAG: polysulfide reductase NrfD, partial [bacterium]|nr:polysulfide reductase NrfD [bacterium]
MNNAVMKLSKNYYPLVGLLFLLISAAVVSYFYQVTHGLAATGLREPVTWGFYVVFSTFFYGLGAGIMMMLMVGLIKKKIQAESTLLYSLAALVSLILAGAFIIINLGRPDRFYFILLHLQPGSPLM